MVCLKQKSRHLVLNVLVGSRNRSIAKGSTSPSGTSGILEIQVHARSDSDVSGSGFPFACVYTRHICIYMYICVCVCVLNVFSQRVLHDRQSNLGKIARMPVALAYQNTGSTIKRASMNCTSCASISNNSSASEIALCTPTPT